MESKCVCVRFVGQELFYAENSIEKPSDFEETDVVSAQTKIKLGPTTRTCQSPAAWHNKLSNNAMQGLQGSRHL